MKKQENNKSQEHSRAIANNLKSTNENKGLSMMPPPLQFKSLKGEEEEGKKPIQKKSNPNGMPEKVQTKMGNAFGQDFSNVNIHTNSNSAKDMGALAYAQGNDVHFASGQYNPESSKGQELIGHELTHVVQQREGRVKPTTQAKGVAVNNDKGLEKEADEMGRKVVQGKMKTPVQQKKAEGGSTSAIQMLKKADYPWTGMVVDTPLLAMRDSTNGNTLADLPTNTRITVTGESGGWLQISVDTSQSGVVVNKKGQNRLIGTTLEGYSYHSYIDDAAARGMQNLLGETAAWIGSGPGSGNTFETWASAATESAAPPLNSSTSINCWEMVLYAAYQVGAIDWNWIHNLYVNVPIGDWIAHLTRGSSRAYVAGTTSPNRGDLVFFDGLAHVALATGNADEIYTFWPPPNTPFNRVHPRYKTVDQVKTSTIQALDDYSFKNWGSRYTVTLGSPSW